MDLTIQKAVSDRDFEVARILFQEYQASIPLDLGFQGFGHEVASLPGKYAEPDGVVLLAGTEGCVAVRPLAMEGVCELKRLFVRPEARGNGLGWKLLNEAIRFARERGYQRMRLDTLATMTQAIAMYRTAGFAFIDRYNDTPDAVFLELVL